MQLKLIDVITPAAKQLKEYHTAVTKKKQTNFDSLFLMTTAANTENLI